MRSSYLFNLSYGGRSVPLLGTLFSTVFCDTLLMIYVYLALSLRYSDFLLSLLAAYLLPFLIFAAGGAALADKMPKRGAIILGKIMETAAMVFACFAVFHGQQVWIYASVFLAGMTSAFLLPSYSGILHETFSERYLSKSVGDSLFSGFLAGVCGILTSLLCGNHLFRLTSLDFVDIWPGREMLSIGIPLCVISILGLLLSFRIYPTAVDADQKAQERRARIFSLKDGIMELTATKSVVASNIGVTLFFLLFTAIELLLLCMFRNSPRWAELSGHGTPLFFEALFPCMIFAISLGIGFVLCGKLSGGKVECGLVPFGALGLAIFLPLAASWTGNPHTIEGIFSVIFHDKELMTQFQWYPLQTLWLFLAGLSAGLIPVPLLTFLHASFSPEAKGAAFATSNAILFLLLSAMLLREDFFNKLSSCGLNLNMWLAIAGIIPLITIVVVVFFLPWLAIRSLAVLLTHSLYKLTVKGAENIPAKGGALLIANHSSYVDSLLILACTSRQVRFLIHEKFYRHPLIHPFAKMVGSIEVPSSGKHRLEKMLEDIRSALRSGKIVCVFPEGKVSRNGVMGDFKAGYARMLPDDCEIPLIPISVGLVWGSIFSNYSKKTFSFFHPARVSIGKPMNRTDVDTAFCLRQAISILETEVSMTPMKREKTLHYQFAKNAKRHPFRRVFCQHGGEEYPMFKTLVSAVVLSREIRKIAGDSKYIGILIPNSVTLVTTILACLYADKVPVPLNHTVSKDTLRKSMEKAEISTLLVDKAFLEKARIEWSDEMVELDKIIENIKPSSRFLWGMACLFLPHQELMTYVSPQTHREVDGTAIVLFSSGSTGQPKGVMLSHHNVNADVDSFVRALSWTEKDRMLGSLPLFHSFGMMTSFWLPAIVGCKVVYVTSPLECSQVEEAAIKNKLTIILATPTFMAAYLRRCSKETFANLRFSIVGAEKLRKDIVSRFKEVTDGKSLLLEAYGCTELAPVVTVNIGSNLLEPGKECGKEGSIGVALQGISVRIVDPVTREELPPGMDGLLLVKGPIVMQGYIADPVRTANVISDGWYETGDIGHMDPDGYITLSGRLSRFSKIAGEMVPHELLECIMGEIIGRDERVFAVGGIPDKTKGEALVVVYLKEKMNVTPEEMNEFLRKHNIPNLWIPRTANYRAVDSLPVTGTGKLDLVHLNEFIKKEFSSAFEKS